MTDNSTKGRIVDQLFFYLLPPPASIIIFVHLEKPSVSLHVSEMFGTMAAVLPTQFCSKSRTLAIFCQKTAIYRHYPSFIAFLCGNELAKYRQMAKIGDFCTFPPLKNRGFGDLSPQLATLRIYQSFQKHILIWL